LLRSFLWFKLVTNMISRKCVSCFRRNLINGRRSFYSGPESTPDFTGQLNTEDTVTARQFVRIYQRVKDYHEGKNFNDPKESIVDLANLTLYDLKHSILTKEPEKYHVEVGEEHYTDTLIGNAVKSKEVVGESSTVSGFDPDFLRPEVQELLINLTERSPEKIFLNKQGLNTQMPQLRLMTDLEIEQEIEKKDEEAKALLRSPAVMLERSEIDDVIAHDELLDGYEIAKVVFTDISDDLPAQERFVVVRETNGILRKAKWAERDRMMQTYYPRPHCDIFKPYWAEDMTISLENNLHENLLEKILWQFVADSSDYIERTEMIYNHIEANNLYDLLRSTRFYGPLVFYLTKHRSIDGLLRHLMNDKLPSYAGDLVKLFTHLKPDSNTSKLLAENENLIEDSMALIKTFIDNDAVNVNVLQQTLETLEINMGDNVEAAAEASG